MTLERFTASQLWTCPANVHRVAVECEGAGASGGKAAVANTGGGGGGGAYAKTNTVAVVPGQQYQVTVGAGGIHINGSEAGVAGGDSWFSTTGVAPTTTAEGCLAKGGTGAPNASGAGTGGSAALSVGDTKTAGNNGLSTAGNNAGWGITAGNITGGTGGNSTGVPSVNGTPVGAAGAGGAANANEGGDGARGEVVLVYTAATTGTFTGVYDFSGTGFTGQAGPGQGEFTGVYDFSGAFTGQASPPVPGGGSDFTPGGRNRFTARRGR